MFGSSWSMATFVASTLLGPPALPGDAVEDGEEATAELAVSPGPVEAELAVSPGPVEAEPAVSPGPVADDDRAPLAPRSRRGDRSGVDPVERFSPGQWGMQFTFGGLAPMTIGGLRDLGVNRLLFTELGFRRVLSESWVLPFSIGAGVFHHQRRDDDTDPQNDVGLSASVGIQRYFRVWRRIAPYVGGRLRLTYGEPHGRANWHVAVGLGPTVGIEYFVGDRVSLALQGDAQIGIHSSPGLAQVSVATRVDAGGQLGLVFYF